jgi:hypothetical protein
MKFLLLSTLSLLILGCNNTNLKEEKKSSKESTVSTHYSQKQLELKSIFEQYLQQLQTLNTDKIIEMTYPRLFVPINKDLFKHYIETLLNSPQIKIISFDTNITKIGEVKNYSSGYFAQLSYISSITLNFIDPELYSDDLSLRVLNDVLSRKYGQKNIIVDRDKRTILIRKEEKMLAIKEKSKEWKFIGDNPAYRELYPKIIASDILSEIQ